MPASAAILGYGTLLKMGDGGGTEVFTSIAEVRDISGPSFARDAIDVSQQTSPGLWAEFIPGRKDAGEVTFTIAFLPTNAQHGYATGLLRDYDQGNKRNFQLVFPNVGNTTWSFSAYVTGMTINEPTNEALTADVTLKITGQPTLV